MSQKLETYEQLVERMAYKIVSAMARGTPAMDVAHSIVQQVNMWTVAMQDASKEKGR